MVGHQQKLEMRVRILADTHIQQDTYAGLELRHPDSRAGKSVLQTAPFEMRCVGQCGAPAPSVLDIHYAPGSFLDR
jgi:hypothetical protein